MKDVDPVSVMAALLGLAMVIAMLTGCGGELVGDESEPCDVEPTEITLPDRCWEDPSCTLEDDVAPGCGRAYVCIADDIGEICIRARDCACLFEAEAECSGEVFVPGYCEYLR